MTAGDERVTACGEPITVGESGSADAQENIRSPPALAGGCHGLKPVRYM
jgi:hypothetical protein